MRNTRRVTNSEIAQTLGRVASLLEAQHASAQWVEAHRCAAHVIHSHPRPIRNLLAEGGQDALLLVPGIGRSVAAAIRELVFTGRLGYLRRLEGDVSPEDLFTLVPGIGEALATRVHEALEIDTLEELEQAAYDGRLEALPGFGHRRARAVRAAVDALLGQSMRRRARRMTVPGVCSRGGPVPKPGVRRLLDVDREYTRGVQCGALCRITPRRHDRAGLAVLPILHTERDGWHFTALYSNTAIANAKGMTADWVVIHYERYGDEDQVTVITECRGRLAGQRILRGREEECREYYLASRLARESNE